jgi:hypothetical protein
MATISDGSKSRCGGNSNDDDVTALSRQRDRHEAAIGEHRRITPPFHGTQWSSNASNAPRKAGDDFADTVSC